MKNKRGLAVFLVMLLAAAFSLPAFAADAAEGAAVLTRGEFVSALFELSGETVAMPHQEEFSDVQMHGGLAGAIRWAVDNGIVKGYGDGRFGPDDPLTREQMAAMLYRNAQALGLGFSGAWMFLLDYPDAAEISAYADEAMHWVVVNEIIVGTGQGLEPQAPATDEQLSLVLQRWQNVCSVPNASGIDYLVLVNKLNALPEDWEAKLDVVKTTNTLGDDIEVERTAYRAYLALKADLAQNDGVYIELDSARRSVAAQQDIMDRFIEKYGADYAAKTVAVPGYSEHHTGLALDLYLRVDGQDVYYNEDMVQYPQIWEKIHAKLAAYGFILRYLDNKEHITGYGYEPWHIRYIDSAEIAGEIASRGVTLEGYLGAVKETEPAIDYGSSELYSTEELKEAAVQIKCRFASWEGCELHSLRYAGDACNSEENIKWLNGLDEGKNYTQVAEFLCDFHSPLSDSGAFEPDTEYTDYQWWLARSEEGGWQLLSWGY